MTRVVPSERWNLADKKLAALCGIFGIAVDGSAADRLWETCVSLRTVKRSQQAHTPEVVLMHERCLFDRVLVAVAKGTGRAPPVYEFQWELNARFGEIFADLSLAKLEMQLARRPSFARDASSNFALAEHIDLLDFDLDATRDAAQERHVGNAGPPLLAEALALQFGALVASA